MIKKILIVKIIQVVKLFYKNVIQFMNGNAILMIQSIKFSLTIFI